MRRGGTALGEARNASGPSPDACLHPVIVLLTDFGDSDPFAGVMKGVLLSRCPGARIVDLSHDVAPQDVSLAAFYLMGSAPYFPPGSIFVCVVDPGVGSGRRVLWARGSRHQFLAPDNGLLSWVGRAEPLAEVREVANSALFLKRPSATFHGRDVFAPVAAALARGEPPESLGPRARSWRRLPFPPLKRGPRSLRGVVMALDRFGNAVTNLPASEVPDGSLLRCARSGLVALKSHYASVPAGAALAVTGSMGFIELSVRDGSFAQVYGAVRGAPVEAALPPRRAASRVAP